jgi:predicted dehydrogenase
MDSPVRMGVVGVGIRGSGTAQDFLDGVTARATLAAVCDVDATVREAWNMVPTFESSEEMIRSGLIDAVYIATPHYSHTTIGIDALNNGLHVLVEKPISVHKADAERLIGAHEAHPELVFAAMFNQRTDPHYTKLKAMIESGELGEIRRTNWIITDWFRSDAYYAHGGWRATWQGEGGGVLLNQCPHNLDLFQWICGKPSRIQAFCSFGKYHDIEVEDEVTAYFEYPNGATGVFVTTTGEAPGTNRLEIAGDKGKVVVERSGAIRFTRNEVPADVFRRETESKFGKPPAATDEIAVEGRGGQHREICRNFVDAILDGVPLIAPAAEGIHSVEMANAMLMSTLEGRAIDLPMDGAAYETRLMDLVARSTGR